MYKQCCHGNTETFPFDYQSQWAVCRSSRLIFCDTWHTFKLQKSRVAPSSNPKSILAALQMFTSWFCFCVDTCIHAPSRSESALGALLLASPQVLQCAVLKWINQVQPVSARWPPVRERDGETQCRDKRITCGSRHCKAMISAALKMWKLACISLNVY